MHATTKKANQVLAKEQRENKRADLMVYIVNLCTPYEGFNLGGAESTAWTPEEYLDFTDRLRQATKEYWPELWQAPSPKKQSIRVEDWENQSIRVEDRAWEVIHRMREYLRRFWRADNEYDRDWHIHRAREWWYSLQVLPELQKTVAPGLQYRFSDEPEPKLIEKTVLDSNTIDETAIKIKQQYLLDIPPRWHDPITKALYELQLRARKPSTAPRICPNECENRYFLSNTKGEVYCPECRRSQAARNKSSKRNSYHANKDRWPSTAKRRKERG
jgi:hypothetical protein